MAKRTKDGGWKNNAIIALSVVVLFQGYLLWVKAPRTVAAPKKSTAVAYVPKPVAAPPVEKKAAPRPAPAAVKRQAPAAGRIAVIIDDWGYSTRNCGILTEIHEPVTVAVLPNLVHTRDVLNCAQKAGKEIILHLPLEPHQNNDDYPDGYIIRTSMSARTVDATLEQVLNNMPGIVGVNNHMGSKATEDETLMGAIFTKLKRRGLFFVDSRVTAESIVGPLADRMRLPYAERDVFLDNTNERAYIEAQFAVLVDTARKHGSAVGIGHDRELTMQVVKEQMRHWEDQGFEFVTIKSLIQSRR
jgi:polysaccharide deacetylase 2 family uncharacterized protein YibQ